MHYLFVVLIFSSVSTVMTRNAKDMTWHSKSFRWPKTDGMKTECNYLILSMKGWHKKNDAKAYINNVHEAMLEHYHVFAKTHTT